jgi:uncharacterized repeat protein (TIGR02543 family)
MKNRKHWFAGLAFALPVAVLLVVLGSMQPAFADVDEAALPHAFYGGVEYRDGGLVPVGIPIHGDDGEGLGRVYIGVPGNPMTTTVAGLFGGPGVFDGKLLIQGDITEMERDMPIEFYIDGEPADVQECDTSEPEVWYTSWPWLSGGKTCLNMKADPGVRYTMTVAAGECCPITVTVGGDDTLIPAGEEHMFPEISSAQLTAITDTCCNFVQWEVMGHEVITDNPAIISMADYDMDVTVEATCEVPTFTLTTNVDPLGSGDVLQDPAPPHLCGTAVTVTAVPTSAWRFVEWSGALTGTVDHGTIEMYSNEVVTAHFAEATHPLTVTSDGCRPISVTGAVVDVVAAGGSATYVISYGLTVTLDVLDAECCVFDEWQVDGAPVAGDPIVVLVDAKHTAVALSHGPPFTLTLLTAGRGGGTVEGSGSYTPCHTMATITATADEHSVFAGWSGDVESMNPVEVVDMDADKTVTATFNLMTYTMTISDSVPPEGGTVEIGEEWPDPEGEYEYGETITVTAVPSYCYEFVGWGGDLEGYPNPAVFTVTKDMAFFAIFQWRTHSLDVNVVGEGDVTLDPPGGVYSCCTWITLTAEPAEHWQFDGWSGGLGDTKVITVHMDQDLVVTATFAAETHVVTITDPDGGVIVPDPTQPPEGYDHGTVVTLTATADYCYEFVEWGGDLAGETDNPIVITVTEKMTITAVFERQEHTLTVNVAPPGGGTVDPPGGTYTCCTWVTVIATPTTGYTFTGWLGDIGAVPSMTNPIDIHIGEEDLVVTATFYSDIQTYTLTVATAGDGNGTVDPDVGTHVYLSGTVVLMTADPDDPASRFAGWSGALTGTDLTGTITMDSDKEVTATFTSGYVLTVTSDGCCSISVEYDTTVETVAAGDTEQYDIDDGVVVTLTAIPADELCGFDGWQVDGGPVTGNPINVTMNADHIAVATCTRHFIFLPVVARNYSP